MRLPSSQDYQQLGILLVSLGLKNNGMEILAY
jgi:hypothetical protein